MPVLLPSPKYSLVSKRPSPFASRSATTPPFFSLPLCSAIYKSPLGATTACRALPTSSAATRAQKPTGRVSPPLSTSQESAPANAAGLVIQHEALANNPRVQCLENTPSLRQPQVR